MKTLDELQRAARPAAEHFPTAVIAAWSRSPSAAFSAAVALGWNKKQAWSCKTLAMIIRDFGLDEYEALMERENPPAYKHICLCECHVRQLRVQDFLDGDLSSDEDGCDCCNHEERCFHVAHSFGAECPLDECPEDEDEDPCEGCEHEDDKCEENCEGCSNYEEDDPCDGCDHEYDVCAENCSGCPDFDGDDECEEIEECECDEDTRSMLERVSERLFETVGKTFRIEVYESSVVNASTNGSVVFVSTAAVEQLDESELAWLISHEIAHIEDDHVGDTVERFKDVARTAGETFQNSKGFVSGLIKGLVVGTLGYAAACGAQRHHEFKADLKAKEIVKKAGYDPEASVKFFEKHGGAGGKVFDSHPSNFDRIRNIKRNGR